METPAVVLLSGGLDSTTVLAIAKSRGFNPYALSFRYGQRHAVELVSAQRVAEAQGVARHVVADIDLRVFGGSALDCRTSRSPSTTPSRNCPTTRSLRPTCRRETRSSCRLRSPTQKRLGRKTSSSESTLSTTPDIRTVVPSTLRPSRPWRTSRPRAGVDGAAMTIHTPLIAMTKAQIVRAGLGSRCRLQLDLVLLRPQMLTGKPCGRCDSCLLRLKGFAEAGQSRSAHLPGRLTWPTRSRRSSTPSKGRVSILAGQRFSAGSQVATSGRGGNVTASERSASSATPTSSAPTESAVVTFKTATRSCRGSESSVARGES